MHDPSTVAFEIKSPISRLSHVSPSGKVWRYRAPLITIWHEDPETDGSDDSCGWSWPKASPADRERCKRLADEEFDFWLGKYYGSASGGIEFTAHEVVWWAWKVIAGKHGRSIWKRPLSCGEENRIHGLVCNPHDNIRRFIRDAGTKEGLESLFLCVDRLYRDFHRPWWRHPRFHVHHWRLQIHPWETLRRWLFTRCDHCGRRFSWRESPISHGWGCKTTPWFGSTPGLFHQKGCSDAHARIRQSDAAQDGAGFCRPII